jgi:hypothetical protein
MASAYHHAISSARRFGGEPADYQAIHDWLDETKAHLGDFRHRALRHHTLGIFWAEERFGTTITNSRGAHVPVRLVAEQHIVEDFGKLPTVQDWLTAIAPAAWMNRPRKLSRELPPSHGPAEERE